MKSITVFTPTFNRAYCLHRLYQSLCGQTAGDFLWLVIDDGSTDNTKELIASWQKEGLIEIRYHYKQNGGMHTGHNAAYELIDTAYNVCIDSDDYMPLNAIEIIKRNISGLGSEYAGLVGLDIDPDGAVIGTPFPEGMDKIRLQDAYLKHKVRGDKKLVYKTDIIRKYPRYPEFEGEKFVPLGYLYYLIDRDYVLKPVNEPLVVVEYQADGSSRNILRQYKRNPLGFAHSRNQRINISSSFKDIVKNQMHLTSAALFAKNPRLIFQNKYWFLAVLLIPAGLLLHLYILYKIRA